MTCSSVSLFQLLSCCLIVLSILPFISHASDPDPLQDFCVSDNTTSIIINGFPCKPASKVTSDDFFFDASKPASTIDVFKRSILIAAPPFFPGLNTQGLSFARVDLGVGGINPPHTHPRATEAGIVLEGRVLVGFVTTANVFFSKVLTKGMLFVIPRGLVHFELNVGNEHVAFLAIFNSQNPGVSSSVGTLFSAKPPIPEDVLTKTFRVNATVINIIKKAQASNQQVNEFGTWSIY